MVIYFECIDPTYIVYMGVDKYENEDLIKYGLDLDIWFHVDRVSSPHVYFRMKPGQSWDDIPQDILDECCQIVKDGSIKGSKMEKVDIVYTPWSNLRKTAGMDVGQVGFRSEKLVRKIRHVRRDKDVVRRVLKTKQERSPDLKTEQESYLKEVRAKTRADAEKKRVEDEKAFAAARKLKEKGPYAWLSEKAGDAPMQSNKARTKDTRAQGDWDSGSESSGVEDDPFM